MKRFGFGTYALSGGVAVAMLAGCGGSQTPIAAPGAMPHTAAIAAHADRGKSWMLPEAKNEDLIYATAGCLGTCVFSYPGGKLVGTLDVGFGGSYATSGDCTDANGNVFISNNQNIFEYAHGGAAPIATLDLPGSNAIGCSVDPTTGNLAVVFSGSGKNVAIFPDAMGTPALYDSDIDSMYCGYDNAGNLFVDGLGSENAPSLAELPSGSSEFSAISVSQSVGLPGQIQWDGRYITYQDLEHENIAVSRLDISGSNATIVSKATFDIKKTAMQSWIYGNKIFIPYADTRIGRQSRVGVWKYPKGGRPTTSIRVTGVYQKTINFQAVTFSSNRDHAR
jgi:hypothetical protein